ncbi:hypothetical protein [Stakelama saccharophila]|uniref:Uncharacterized protein n=1 Tax=Stakelama saccharophila TaxID=3075605 RepID=A0ABZ0B5R7_9SPHN|nr:hypothetical protein [Stakelama sp. W311]WNO52635.1 hypothetical protein RPR59_09160 [Stakelama sp. W311]
MNMFANTKRTASLSSSLLARKGQARPAMRPQGFVGMSTENLEDLGWNDMGDAAVAEQISPKPMPDPAAAEVPQVLRQREELGSRISSPEPDGARGAGEPLKVADESETVTQAAVVIETEDTECERPVSLNTAARLRRETRKKRGKAAFTLRLDPDRHLRLRLAAAIRGRSAQNLVTEALDAFLDTIPAVDGLYQQVAADKRR